MRLSLRLILPLAIVLLGIAYAIVPLMDRLTTRWAVRDLDIRASLIANTVHDSLAELSRAVGSKAKITAFFNKIIQDERLFAVGLCSGAGEPPTASRNFPAVLSCARVMGWGEQSDPLLDTEAGPLHVAVRSLEQLGGARLALVHDMSFTVRRSAESRSYLVYLFLAIGAVISFVTVTVVHISWRGWERGIRALLSGEILLRPADTGISPELQPIARDLRALVRELEQTARQRDEAQVSWTPDTLRALLKAELRDSEVIVLANREPYIHVRKGDTIEVQRPASGLVTALEPIMRACSGTWIAHGSGSADRATVDAHDRVEVPPEQPAYRIRRVWLTPEEEQGYYYGFANEGLWPLCHIAHMRPVFRTEDWNHYREVNRKFAEAVVAEAKRPDPIVLVQDYHFALAPRMIRERLPAATIISFWHIPWPNPESFSVCPFSEELLAGMLGSSILGFHTQFHCNNFVDTVDRVLEARVDRESFTVTFGGKSTAVRRYPISIAWPPEAALCEKPVPECRDAVRARYGLPPSLLIGVGVDRLDYTKGILERFRAVERLFELDPSWIGRFSFIQLAAPTRSSIETYQDYEARVRAAATRINARYSRNGVPPIVLSIAGHGAQTVFEHYRASDLCFVSSLHDGMNLVAKEFVAARDDERGVLILSQFAGASRELVESIVVNPYDEDECAAALKLALEMPLEDQRDRMRLMRSLVREFNVFRWAGRMLLDAGTIRQRTQSMGRRPETVA
jgi:trehalose 6-phosphate synthase